VAKPAAAGGEAVKPPVTVEERLAALEGRLARLENPGASPAPAPGKTAVAPDGTTAAAAGALRPPPPTSRLILRSPMTGYLMILLTCVIVGVMLASPWVIYQIWAFVGVGLHVHERKYVYVYGPVSLVLFLGGGAMFFFGVLPIGLQALMTPAASIAIDGYPILDPSFMLDDYLHFVAMMTLVFGIAFQTPLVVMFLARTGIVSLETMARQQKIVILIMVVIAAVLTPTPDPFNMMIMAVPLVLLYEVGLLLAWLGQRSRRKREAAEALADGSQDTEALADESEDAESQGAEAAETPQTPGTTETPETPKAPETPETPDEYSSGEPMH
jgi:Tat protein translocase TatC